MEMGKQRDKGTKKQTVCSAGSDVLILSRAGLAAHRFSIPVSWPFFFINLNVMSKYPARQGSGRDF